MQFLHNHSAKTLYHLTEHDYGKEAFWHPKENGIHRTEIEPKVPRICFSLSITGCFLALGHIATYYSSWHLYTTLGEYYTPTSSEIIDAPISQEVWRLQPTLLKKKHSFSNEEMSMIKNHLYFTAGNDNSIKYQLKFKPRINKIVREIFDGKTQTQFIRA